MHIGDRHRIVGGDGLGRGKAVVLRVAVVDVDVPVVILHRSFGLVGFGNEVVDARYNHVVPVRFGHEIDFAGVPQLDEQIVQRRRAAFIGKIGLQNGFGHFAAAAVVLFGYVDDDLYRDRLNLAARGERGDRRKHQQSQQQRQFLFQSSLLGPTIPDSMIPDDIKSMLQGGDYELAFVCSKYESATAEVNAQIGEIDEIVKSYDPNALVIGEAPMMKDLEDVTNVDLVNVNTLSIAAIFVIIMLTFKSISLPIILVSVIEFAIMVNMAVPYYQGVELPFVASIVVGTIQLGATVDYAILMTSRYQKERRSGKNKKEAVLATHKACMLSIITSGISFFAATFGVAAYSKVDMIGAICTLLSRGALISMVVVLGVLPAMFLLFDKVICMTTIDFLGKKEKKKKQTA